jgi:hypothetical protein
LWIGGKIKNKESLKREAFFVGLTPKFLAFGGRTAGDASNRIVNLSFNFSANWLVVTLILLSPYDFYLSTHLIFPP